MHEILKDIGKGLIGLLIAVFLPKQIFISIRELIVFGLKAIIKYWIFNCLVVIFLVFVFFKMRFLSDLGTLYFSISLFFLLFVLSIIFRLFSFYSRLNGKNQLMVYGCYSSKEKEYLFVDLDAAFINDRLINECNQLRDSLFILKSKTLRLDFIEFPKFMPILLGYRGTIKFFEKFIKREKHISSLYYIRDIADQKILTNIIYDKRNFINAELLSLLISLQNKLSTENTDVKEVAEINLKLYVLVFGQSFLDYFVDAKDFDGSKKIIEDTEKILLEVKEKIVRKFIDGIEGFTSFFNIWSSYIDRYKAILLLEQDELKGAISYIISSIKLNPYYPYSNYQKFKTNFSKRYGVELSYSIEGFEVDNKNNFEKIRNQLSSSIESKEAEFNTKIIHEIINRDVKQNSLQFLENELSTLDNSNPAILLLKSDVIKYLPDGTDKVNEIYYGRIDETISILNKITKIDDNFPVIKAKIGSLMMSKAAHDGNQNDIEKSIKIWTEGMHFLTELGFQTK